MKRARVTEELAYGSALDRLTGSDKPAPAPPKREPLVPPKTAVIKLSVFVGREEDA